MPKIFLIKNRLHQQQLKLLESQNLIQKNEEGDLNIIYNPECDGSGVAGPLSLVAKKDGHGSGKWSYSDSNGSSSNATGKIDEIAQSSLRSRSGRVQRKLER